jgi:alkylation response protein AidB-like acyl-CoA dehydrogenase
VFASEVAVRVAYDAIQIHGGYGYSAEYEVERYWRDAKYTTLAEGTNDLVRLELASGT